MTMHRHRIRAKTSSCLNLLEQNSNSLEKVKSLIFQLDSSHVGNAYGRKDESFTYCDCG